MKKTVYLSLSLLISSVGFAQNNKVSIDLTTQKFYGSTSELSREKYFSGHFSYTDGDLAEDADYLFGNLGIKFGRSFAGPRSFGKDHSIMSVEEASAGGTRTNKSIIGGKLFKDYATRDLIITAHPKEAFAMNADYNKIAAYDAAYIKTAFPVLPRYYEVMNEPFVHAIDFVKTYPETDGVIIEMSKLHKVVADKVHAEVPDIMVGGYSAAWPEYEKNNFAIWDSRMKTFMDIAGESMDFFATHLYDGVNVTGGFVYRSGSNSEAILDLIEAYSYIKWGKIKPHLISEYGYTAKNMQGKPYSPESDGICLVSYNKILMGLLDKPDRILKAVPFIVGRAPWFYKDPKNTEGNPYPWVISRKMPDGSYQLTHLVKFYELWKGVEGDAIAVNSNNPDIQVNGYASKGKIFIAMNNLDDKEQKISLDFLHNSSKLINKMTLRRLFLDDKGIPQLQFSKGTKTVDELVLKPGETVVLDCDTKKIEFDNTLNEDNYYAKTYLQKIEANTPLTFEIEKAVASKNGSATIRMGISRAHNLSKSPKVTINGTPVEVPNNWAGYDQAPREQFFGVIPIPVAINLIKEGKNTITITFPDAGGFVSSVILNEERLKK